MHALLNTRTPISHIVRCARLLPCPAAAPATVAKLQVGVLASGGARLKRDLDALAEAADTGSAQGLHALMQGAR